MIKVSIPAVVTRNMSGIGKTSQKAYNMDFQTVYFHTVGKDGKPAHFPEKVDIILEKGENGMSVAPYPVGEYQLHPSSIYVGRDGNVSVAPRLIALAR